MRRNAKRLEMWKRLFAILIAGVMLFSNVSNAVFALEGSVGETVNTDETEGQDSEKTDQAETLTSDPEGEDPKTESPEDTEKSSVVEDTEEDPQEEAEVWHLPSKSGRKTMKHNDFLKERSKRLL